MTATQDRDGFAGDYNIDTPESVAFDYRVADVGNRFIAALIDIIIVSLALIGLNAALFAILQATVATPAITLDDVGETGNWVAGLVITLYALLNFLIFWGYFTLLELKWNGQTLGKRMVGIRVVRADGSPAGASEVAIRNLVRIVDLLPSAYLLGLAVMLAHRDARRLGDLAGGTLVVKQEASITLDSLVTRALSVQSGSLIAASPLPRSVEVPAAGPAPDGAPVLAPPDIRGLRPTDYGLITELLGRDSQAPVDAKLLVRLASAVATRIGYNGDVTEEPRGFLRQVAEAYRRHGRGGA